MRLCTTISVIASVLLISFAISPNVSSENLNYNTLTPGAAAGYFYDESNFVTWANVSEFTSLDGTDLIAQTTGINPYSADWFGTLCFTNPDWSAFSPYSGELPAQDSEIVELSIVLYAAGGSRILPGNLSYCTDYPYETIDEAHPKNYGTWYTSNTSEYFVGDPYPDYYENPSSDTYGNLNRTGNKISWTLRDFDESTGISTGRNFTVEEVTSFIGFRVIWNFTNSNAYPQYFNYVGIEYTYTVELPSFNENPDITLENLVFGIILTMIFFLPAICINYFVPKIGFSVGISIMLVAYMWIYGAGFLYVVVVGFISVGLLFYKSEEEYV